METRKHDILQVLRAFARQRPGLDFCNYGDVRAYRAESRDITRDLHHAETLLSAVQWRDSITADDILQACSGAFSGRLTVTESPGRRVTVDYCTGQYWPTEYRRAVCSVLSSVLWNYWRENGASTGDDIRREARRELGHAIARRWFR